MEILIKIVHFFAVNLWFTGIIVTILIGLQIAIPVFRANSVAAAKEGISYKGVWKKLLFTTITMVGLVMAMIRLPDWNSSLLYHYGKEGIGVITHTERTTKMFNNQYIMRYSVLIKNNDGNAIETTFESSDFNVYPSGNAVTYPKIGETFALRHLLSDPKIFVILTDKESAYTRRLACSEAFEKVFEAKIRFESDSANNVNRREYIQALERLLQENCYKGEPLEIQYIRIDKQTIARLKAGN